jgi:hypothetical protein
MIYKEGCPVKYNGEETHIEYVIDEKTCKIANPYWNWDEEAYYINSGLEYCVPYWITVKFSELEILTKNVR